MPRKAIEITLAIEQREQLEIIVRSHSAQRRKVERAGIILACAAGKQNHDGQQLFAAFPLLTDYGR